MSGILDNRLRIMDTIVTLEGRRQIADGKLKVEYVSFTDSHTYYDADVVSGSADVTKRLYFENCHLPQDQITFEADDSGKLKPFKNNKDINLSSGKISTYSYQEYSGSFSTKTAKENITYLTGSEFASTAGTLLASSIDNYKNLYALGTVDYLFDDVGFSISNSSIQFEINDEVPIKDVNIQSRILKDLPSIFEDKLFSKSINFKYLPPINRVDNESVDKSDQDLIEQNKIGNYSKLNSNDEYTNIQLEDDLSELEKKGFKKTLYFDPTSPNNKIVSQIFEISNSDIKKLDIIDYGPYQYNDSLKHAFFVGKVLVDENGTDTFIKLFTLVFE